MAPVAMKSVSIIQTVMPTSNNSPTGVSGPPEYVRARLNTLGYDKWMHEVCYLDSLKAKTPLVGKGIWKQALMNNYFRGKMCMGCHMKLQCKCNPYKVTEALTGKCAHA